MRGYTTLPVALTGAGNDCDKTAESIYGELMALRSYVENLLTQWQGVAPPSFANLMTRYQTDANNLNHALRGIAGTLRYTAMTYTHGEEEANRAVNSVYLDSPTYVPISDAAGNPFVPGNQGYPTQPVPGIPVNI